MTASTGSTNVKQEIMVPIEIPPRDKFTGFMVLETELEMLERGSKSSIYLNFALPLIFTATTLIASLLLADIRSPYTLTCFVTVAATFLVVGSLLVVLWYKGRRSTSQLSQAIRGKPSSKGTPIPIAAQTVKQDVTCLFELITAHYGSEERMIEVTDELRRKVVDGELTVAACNDIAGDPHQLVKKSLHIVYLSKGRVYRATIPEGRTLTLPE